MLLHERSICLSDICSYIFLSPTSIAYAVFVLHAAPCHSRSYRCPCITPAVNRDLTFFPLQLPGEQFEEVRSRILTVTATTSRSSFPAIYGMVAAAEVERLKPLMGQAAQNDVDALELAGAEMAIAAAELVAKEREIITLRCGLWVKEGQ